MKSKVKIIWYVHPYLPKKFILEELYSLKILESDEDILLNSILQFNSLLYHEVLNKNNVFLVILKSQYDNLNNYPKEILSTLNFLDSHNYVEIISSFPTYLDTQNIKKKIAQKFNSSLNQCKNILTGQSTPDCISVLATMLKNNIYYESNCSNLKKYDSQLSGSEIFVDYAYITLLPQNRKLSYFRVINNVILTKEKTEEIKSI